MTLRDELSIQLYPLRDFGDLEKQLSVLSELGFRNVELVGNHFHTAKVTKASLDRFGMFAPTGHVGLDDLRSSLDWVADQAQILETQELFLPAVPPDDRGKPSEYWFALGAELGEMADSMQARGLSFGYHNHDWELQRFDDGTTALDQLFAGASGSSLTFEADLAWLVRANADPVLWMEKLESRLTAVHVKDIAPHGKNLDEDGWADIGDGTMDWPDLWQVAERCGAKWMILEHDKPSDALRFASTSRAYLASAIKN